MTTRNARFTLALLAVIIALGPDTSFAQERGRSYSMEGAWYGVVTLSDLGLSIPSLDTFTSNPLHPGVKGTFLCTVPAMTNNGSGGWLRETPAGHRNWVRIGRNKYAFTAVRSVFDEKGNMFGRSKAWGTITPISEDEYTGTINVQYYLPDWTPFTPAFKGTLHSQRLTITFEQ